MRGEKMAVCPHGAQHNTLITSLYPPFHPPIPDAQNSQPNSEDHFLSLRFSHFRFPVYVIILFLLPVFFTLFPSLLSSLLIDPLSVTLFLSHSLSVCLNMESIKTNATPRIHGIYFPATANLPPCNEDRSSFKRTARWRERRRERWFISQQTSLIISAQSLG